MRGFNQGGHRVTSGDDNLYLGLGSGHMIVYYFSLNCKIHSIHTCIVIF